MLEWPIVIAALSLAVSLIALRRSSHANRVSNAIQDKVLKIERERRDEEVVLANKANVTATLVSVMHANRRVPSQYLELFNRGLAPARKIEIRLDNVALCESENIPVEKRVAPGVLGSKSEYRIPVGPENPIGA